MPETCNDYALPFATWEVRLYLDTHPGDARALALYQQLCAQSQGMQNYACLPDGNCCSSRWAWIDNPWPWEPEANQPIRGV